MRLSEDTRKQVIDIVDDLCRRGLRVLGLAKKVIEPGAQLSIGSVEQNLQFLGLVAFVDPPRKEVKAAVDLCHKAGIRVVMLTGDHGLTAEAIARHVDIVEKPTDRIVTGDHLDSMDDTELASLLSEEVIFARVTPQHKLRIVKAFQLQGHVVAVTGDGVNDAPALKQANIGIAMGGRGTDVARAAADMILLDDNFATIVKAIELGRTVYANIRNFSTYVFTSNVSEAAPFAVMLFSRGLIPLPLNIMQVLAVDLGTDMLPAIGLGSELPDAGIMQRHPRSLKEPLLNRELLVTAFCWYGALEACAAMLCYFYAQYLFGFPDHPLAQFDTSAYRVATSATLTGIVAAQVAVALCCRSSESIFNGKLFENKLLWIGILLELALLVAILNVSWLQNLFLTKPVPMEVIVFASGCGVAIILIDEIRKWWGRARHQSSARSSAR